MARARPDRQRARAQKGSAAGLIPGDAAAAVSRLFGQPITPTPAAEVSSAHKIWLLQQRLRTLTEPPKANPYQTEFYRFLTEMCWTADEAKGGNEALIPAHPYVREIADAFVERPRLLLSKSRRVLASWICCGYDIWVAAGGQDPRWPALANSTKNRQVFVADRKFDSAARFIKRRHLFILNSFRDRQLWDLWPEFPTWESREGEIEFSNNALLTAVAQGADQLRGPGATLAHLEEIAFWEQAQATIEGLLPILLGGGHVIAITTPNAASYAKTIVDGEINQKRTYR